MGQKKKIASQAGMNKFSRIMHSTTGASSFQKQHDSTKKKQHIH